MSDGATCRHDILRWACAMCLGEDLNAAHERIAELERERDKTAKLFMDTLTACRIAYEKVEAERDARPKR